MAVRDMPLAFVRGCARIACTILSSSVFGGAAADFLEPGILAMQEYVQKERISSIVRGYYDKTVFIKFIGMSPAAMVRYGTNYCFQIDCRIITRSFFLYHKLFT